MKTKSLILYFLKQSGKSLGRTELMKYVYLFEYYYTQMFGKQYTDLKFVRYKFGPNHSAVVEATYSLQEEGLISIDEYTNYFNGTSYGHRLIQPDFTNYQLSQDAELVASFVVDLLWNKNYRGVLEVAYNTPPMKEILEEERVSGSQLYGRVIDMSKSGPIFKSSRQARMEAKKRLQNRESSRGSDREYYSHLVEQYKKYADTRRRANIVESEL
jgi:Protein of unknown function (DUF4065)